MAKGFSTPIHTEFESGRLAELFVWVWWNLPEAARADLAQRLKVVSDLPKYCPPGCETLFGLHYLVPGNPGCIIYLNRDTLEQFTPGVIILVIAHELAHAACGHGHLMNAEIAEYQADMKMWREWGFKPCNIALGITKEDRRAWHREHPYSGKVVDRTGSGEA